MRAGREVGRDPAGGEGGAGGIPSRLAKVLQRTDKLVAEVERLRAELARALHERGE